MLYAIALGSNQRHGRHGPPKKLIEAAIERLPGMLLVRSRIIASRPLGPSSREYANAAALIDYAGDPPELLGALQMLEQALGRRRQGQRWRARTIDLDIILWEGGIWADARLSIPHPRFRERDFVLGPLAEIIPAWRDPISGLSIRQLAARRA